MRKTASVVVVLLTLALASSAQAAPLLISNIQGSWQNIVMDTSGSAVLANDTVVLTNQAAQALDTVRWGVQPSGAVGPDPTFGTLIGSAYLIDPVDNPVPQNNLGIPFVLASFTHDNQPVNFRLISAEYAFQFDTNGVPTPLAQTFQFTHDETLNIPPAPACCDDIVTWNNVGFTQNINVGGDIFALELLGFSPTGAPGTFSNQFISPENQTNNTLLWARVTQVTVPEPATLLLFGSGLALALRRVRRKSA